MKQPATIQVDIDTLWTLPGYYSGYETVKESIYQKAVKRCLKLFRQFEIRATFFIIGKDVMVPENREVMTEILESGHELANHSMNHIEKGFEKLSRDAKYSQILDCHNIIEHYFGYHCKGFKSPAYAMDSVILELLEKLNYTYDSSVYFTSLKPFMSLTQKLKLLQQTSINHWGLNFPHIPPLGPYRLDGRKMWKKGESRLVECGVNSMPVLRLPFHCSFVYAVGLPVFHAGIWLTKKLNLPLNYAFQAFDFADPEELDQRILMPPGVNIPFTKKMDVIDQILGSLSTYYRLVSTKEFIDEYRN